MTTTGLSRRRFCSVAAAALSAGAAARGKEPFVLCTFGDSILDCGHYNARSVHPGALLLRNDDTIFPEFKGQDLASRGAARLAHHAADGSTVDGLAAQLRGVHLPAGPAVALLTVGGNDLLRGLAADTGPGMKAFERTLAAFVQRLPLRPVLLGTVYDPTFGDDSRNFLGVDPRIARQNHERVNQIIRTLAARQGGLADLHRHFLTGDTSWFTHTIEPSLRGASEVRRAFLAPVLTVQAGAS